MRVPWAELQNCRIAGLQKVKATLQEGRKVEGLKDLRDLGA
jgi:hypothetical protein